MIYIIKVNNMKEKGKIFVTKNFEETQNLGREFATRKLLVQRISLLNTVALYGDLGSGKTTFVQGLAEGLRITRRIISPTFVIIRTYKIKIKDKGSMIKNFYHIDLYRIMSHKNIDMLGLEEIIKDPQNIVAIEWAEKMGRLLPEKRWEIRFEYLEEDKRRITIEKTA